MRQVRKGNVSIPLAIVEAYLQAAKDPSSEMASLAIANMHKAILLSHERIQKGLDDSNLKVCIGKLGHLCPNDARRFLSGEIPRITLYRDKKTNHNMPLYFAQKPGFYVKNLAKRKPAAKKKARKP